MRRLGDVMPVLLGSATGTAAPSQRSIVAPVYRGSEVVLPAAAPDLHRLPEMLARRVALEAETSATPQQAKDRGVALLAKHLHPAGGQAPQNGAALGIGAAHGKATLHQDSCQGRHADATNPDEVERLIAIQHEVQERLRHLAENKAEAPPMPGPLFYELRRLASSPPAWAQRSVWGRFRFLYDQQPKNSLASGLGRSLPWPCASQSMDSVESGAISCAVG
jgi:hypothetical protein